MDPNAAPWRALEQTPSADGSDRPDVPGLARPALVALVAAAILGLIAFALAVGSGSGEVAIDGARPGAVTGASAEASTAAGERIVVEIAGAVLRPGVYRLEPGARVGDLVTLAGGYGPRVDAARAEHDLNLAAPVTDGERIRVPSRDDVPGTPDVPAAVQGGRPDGATTGLVDLNRATASELEALPGIGPVTAAKVIAAREETPFTSVDELRSRGLVGPKTFDTIRDLVAVP